MLNAQQVQGQWNQLKGQVRQKWGQLTDNDLELQGGGLDQVIGRIQQRTGEGREVIEKYLGELTSQGASAVSQAAETAREYAGQATDRLRQGYEQASHWGQENYEMAEDYVRQRPGPTIAAAFGIGLVVGLLVGVSSRSR